MGIISTVVFVLFAGTLSSCTNAQYQVRYGAEGAANNLNYMDLMPSEIKEMFKRECQRNGGPQAYNNLAGSWVPFAKCMKPSIQSLAQEYVRTGIPMHAVGQISVINPCPEISALKNCITKLLETVKVCINPEERKEFDDEFETLLSMSDFICENDGRLFNDFVDNGGVECMIESVNLTGCFLQSIDLRSAHETYDKMESCTSLEKIQHCVVDGLEKCGSRKPADAIDSVFDFVRYSEKCKDSLKSSSISINGSLISAFTAIAMLLRFA